MSALAAVRHARERVEKEFAIAILVKARGELCKCTRWVLACTSKYRKLVRHAEARERSFLRVVDARHAKARKSSAKKRQWKFHSKRELSMVMLSLSVVKATK
jgi:hypothetical protein